MPVNIQLEWTPNPSTLKYVVDRKLIPSGAYNFTSPSAAENKSPLAQKLFTVKGITAVMVGGNFVTVTKGEDGEWDELNDLVMETLDTHLDANEPAMLESALVAPLTKEGESAVEKRIREILDNEVRPSVAQDGGDIVLDRFEDGVVYLHMQGSCSGCPSSTMTLKQGIETRLKEQIPEVSEVVSV
jgi:Fe-S cluster biogenesis protein NfuA